MLNNTPAAQSVKFNNIFRNTSSVVTEATTGRIFKEDNFAKDWNTIYVQPSSLHVGEVKEGMRKITKPTLLVSTNPTKMSFVLASDKEPVYFTPLEEPMANSGYLLPYSITPMVTPEFVYYMCEYDFWSKLINNINIGQIEVKENGIVWGIVDGEVSWNNIGHNVLVCGYFDNNLERGSLESVLQLTASMLIDAIGDVILPTLDKQNELVKAAQEQSAKFASLSLPKYDVSELVSKYMSRAQLKSIFSDAGYGLLREAYRRYKAADADTRIIEALSSFNFESEYLTDDELDFLGQHLAEVFDIVVNPSRFAHGNDASFLQPKEVTDFICKIADFPKDVKVYNPFAGAASYAVNLPNEVVGEERELTTWAIAQIRLIANKVNPKSEIVYGDSFASIKDDKKYKAIISSPIFSNQENQEIFDIVRDLYAKLEDGGTLVCLVSPGFLHSSNRSYGTVKRSLIADRAIKAVITLPANIFPGTNIAQSVLVLTKGKPNEEILFAYASGEAYTRFSKSVYRATTFENEQFLSDLEDEIQDFYERGCVIDNTTIGAPIPYSKLAGVDISPKRYLTPLPTDGVALSEYATEVSALRGNEATAEYFITGSSIPESMHRKPFVPTKADGRVATAKMHVQIPLNSVIIALTNGAVRTVYTEGFDGKVAFPGGSVKVLEPKPGVSAKYLAALLSTKTVADQFSAISSGAAIPRINIVDISDIIVPRIDNPEDRERVISDVLASEMSELEIEKERDMARREREIRSTRHAMIQTLAALSSSWNLISEHAEDNNGKIHLSDTIGRINPIPVKNLFTSIDHAVSILKQQVDSLKLEVQDWGTETAIDPYAFINQYIANHESPMFEMKNLGNDNIADVPYFDEETGDAGTHHVVGSDIFYAPTRLVERIIDNIVANAMSHGFTDPNRSDYKIHFDWSNEDSNIVITIANNGTPLKDGVSEEKIFMRGYTTSLNKDGVDNNIHSGQGGYEIKTLMDGYGKAEVISNPGSPFSVVYKLTFEKTNSETLNLFED